VQAFCNGLMGKVFSNAKPNRGVQRLKVFAARDKLLMLPVKTEGRDAIITSIHIDLLDNIQVYII